MLDELCTHIPFFIPAMEEMLCAGLYLSICLFACFFFALAILLKAIVCSMNCGFDMFSFCRNILFLYVLSSATK